MSFDRMIEKIVETQNPTVAGLDPKLAYIPSYILDGAVAKYGKTLEAAAAALLEYNKGLIGGGIGVPPLFGAARQCGKNATVAVGFRLTACLTARWIRTSTLSAARRSLFHMRSFTVRPMHS